MGNFTSSLFTIHYSLIELADRDGADGEGGAAAGNVGPDADILRRSDGCRHLIHERVVVELLGRREYDPTAGADIGGGVGDGKRCRRPLVGCACRDGDANVLADEV